jgi:hypothetical protein
MTPFHEGEINSIFEKLYVEGVACVRWDRVYFWYDAERLSKLTYQDVLDRWEKFCTAQGYSSAPTLNAYQYKGKATLTLAREAFKEDDGKWEPLSNWT